VEHTATSPSSTAESLQAVYTPPGKRNAWWALRHLWSNFLGCWPMVILLVLGCITALPAVLLSVDNYGKRWAFFMFRSWARWMLKGFGVRVWVQGLENLKPGQQYIVTPNHRSHVDVLSLGVALPLIMVSVHKKSLEYIPLVGQALWLSRSVGLDRNDKADAHRRLKLVAQRLGSGRSVVIFPEGRRSKGPHLDQFKKGAVVVAAEQKAPLLPVTVVGTDAIYPPNRLMIHRGDVLIIVHPPIETAGMTLLDRDDLIKRVKASVEQGFVAGPLDLDRLSGATRIA
jgi:1-acyl-sn-glycerol-3-phosphate acyltransferase